MSSKKFSSVILILFLLFMFSLSGMGCGSSSRGELPNPNPEQEQPPESEDITPETPASDDISSLIAEYAVGEIVIGYGTGDNPKYVTQNLTLPTKIDSADISWSSSSAAISSNGTVTRQAQDTDVTLTATATYNGESAARTFNLKVIKKRTRINSEISSLPLETASSGDISITRNDSGDVQDIEGNYVSFDIENADDAIDAVTVIKDELGIENPIEELEPSVITSDKYGAEYQFQQIHNGVKVFGRGLMASVNSKARAILCTHIYCLQKLLKKPTEKPTSDNQPPKMPQKMLIAEILKSLQDTLKN